MRRNIILCITFIIVSYTSALSGAHTTSAWSWLYHHTFSPQEIAANKEKNTLYFMRENLTPFTQLIFSWNAFRPQGYYLFWAQVRNASTKKWGTWHKMMEWGVDRQLSFLTKTDGMAHNEFVRIEADNNVLLDAFKIKIEVCEGASLDALKAFFVSTADYGSFVPESSEGSIKELPSIRIAQVPAISQFLLDHPKNDAICSPTSCSMLLSFLAHESLNPLDIAHNSYDRGLQAYGSWPFNMAHAFERMKGTFLFCTTRLNSFMALYKRLQAHIPVAVSIRGPLEGAASAYKHGHLILVIGWDARRQEVIVHDPAFKTERKVVHRYPLKDFLEAWERSRRLAYIAEPMPT